MTSQPPGTRGMSANTLCIRAEIEPGLPRAAVAQRPFFKALPADANLTTRPRFVEVSDLDPTAIKNFCAATFA
jgi:hypothetical protein